jgi:flavin reductase (DIM6/NTAB) family NADH-FMN oxidoreductase RutF
MDLAQAEFKQAMQRLAGGVCIITTAAADGRRNGLTVTAVCSLSAEPPMLLVSLNKASNTYNAVVANRNIAVNILSEQDHSLAETFSRKIPPEEKFLTGDWTKGVTGAPILRSSVAAFDCELDWVIEVATHGLLLSKIRKSISADRPWQSLLYSGGNYCAVSGPARQKYDTDARLRASV